MDIFISSLQDRIARGPDKKPLLLTLLNCFHVIVRATALRVLPKNLIDPRHFSNVMLKKFGKYFSGDMINVSGWDDRDREGKKYQDYFPHKKSYVVSNASTYTKGLGSMNTSHTKELEIDLNYPIRDDLQKKFDVVFNHTTLEHVVNFEQAFSNLCELSRDAVIIVVPTLQQIHFSKGYGDYWRPTPLTIATLFYRYGFTPLVVTTNDQAFAAVYIFAIGVRDPKKYEGKITPITKFDMGEQLYGSVLNYKEIPELFRKG